MHLDASRSYIELPAHKLVRQALAQERENLQRALGQVHGGRCRSGSGGGVRRLPDWLVRMRLRGAGLQGGSYRTVDRGIFMAPSMTLRVRL